MDKMLLKVRYLKKIYRWLTFLSKDVPGGGDVFGSVQSMEQKPTLPTWHLTRQRASRQSDAGSATETVVEDPRVQELEDMVLALQQEIEETRQDRSGVENGALMRELVASRSETSNGHVQQEHGDYDHGSVAVSTTVV
ncbi:hypothetical protein C0993_002017 [Termitomyces sp. T159_Od127]|nr:hypothetical protein C0993_002017 [Termitomyces sp. T159_Od127]